MQAGIYRVDDPTLERFDDPVAIGAHRTLPEHATLRAKAATIEASARVFAEQDEWHVERPRDVAQVYIVHLAEAHVLPRLTDRLVVEVAAESGDRLGVERTAEPRGPVSTDRLQFFLVGSALALPFQDASRSAGVTKDGAVVH